MSGAARDHIELTFQLLDGPRLSDLQTLPSGVRIDAGEVMAALDPEGHRHLLIPLPAGASIAEQRGAGVDLRVRPLVDGGRERDYLDLRCRNSALDRIFGTFVEDLLGQIEAHPSTPSETTVAVLEEWRDLLRRPAAELTRSFLVGLLAELLVVRELVEVAGPPAVHRWTGWDRDRVDFRASGIAVEVKASTATDQRTFHVNGLRQLEPPQNSHLYLMLHRIESTPAGTYSVPDVIDGILAAGVPASEFMPLLIKAGWDPAYREEAASFRFDLQERVTWEVDDHFPRIVPALIRGGAPSGVTEVEYRVTVQSQPLGTSAESAVIAELANGVATP